jgi:UDP-N-acetylmuramoyl-L-alanyl-D-glutamate--2,6-diaminopimelate ligase
MRQLSSLIGPDIAVTQALDGISVLGLTADSRAVERGMLFAALPGAKANGAGFVADAVARGAVAVLADWAAELPAGLAVPVLRAREPRAALARMAARFYADQPAIAVAVTGTSGKTSVAEFTRQIFAGLGHCAASLGTIGLVKPDGAVYGSLTTPDPVSLHRTLAGLAAEGVTHLAFEASSHGLDQHRLDGVRLTAAAFTNLGHDHLDYHPTVAAYLAAKLRLFSELLEPGRTAVVHAEDPRAGEVIAAAGQHGLRVLAVGGSRSADLRLAKLARDGFSQRLWIEHDRGGHSEVVLSLLGAYQAANALVAAGLAIAAGEEAARVLPLLARLKGVRGRLEIVGERRGGLAVVDYAHKPEALAAALAALRPFATGKLICVFGCGGDRDRGKRPVMGRIASESADVVIVTDDNPRSEDPAAIRAQVLAGAAGAREIGDRAQAIRTAVAMMGPGDVVLVAGKGHETGQIIGDRTVPFSDHEVLAAALDEG